MASQTLLDALNSAIEALEYVRFELERENADQDMARQALDALPTHSVDVPLPQSMPAPPPQSVDAPSPQNVPAPLSQSVPAPSSQGVSVQTMRLMADAAKLAAGVCDRWKFQDEPGEPMDAFMLAYACEEQEASGGELDEEDGSWYIVSPDGAIGETKDGGQNVTWLFLPLNRTVASLPKQLRRGEPWPEPAVGMPLNESVAQTAVCPGCGKPVIPGKKFCMACGASLQSAPVSTAVPEQGGFCLGCGAPLNLGARFCRKCGTKV